METRQRRKQQLRRKFESDSESCSDVESDDGLAKTEASSSRAASAKRVQWWQGGYLTYSTFHQVPRYMQDNKDIHRWYRCGYSYQENWISLFHLHNETFNIWIHYIGCALFVGVAVHAVFIHPRLDPLTRLIPFAPIPVNSFTSTDRYILAGHAIASAFTFVTSGVFHMHLSHSFDAYVFYGCWDYSGISATVAGTGVSTSIYLLACEEAWFRRCTLAGVIAVNLVGVLGPMFKFWPTAEFRPYRAAIYVSSAAVTFLPVFLHVGMNGWSAVPAWDKNVAVPFFSASLISYAVGVFIYVSRVPERILPGKFDLYFASHQLWHFAAVLASFLHFYVIIGLVSWRQAEGVCGVKQ
ncbi:Progestin and adipoQ receptor member 3 [Chytriomyces hyalinus]|nr:Progestin and adipoQ receptor member 3 [Chytriomyces hyalinus]